MAQLDSPGLQRLFGISDDEEPSYLSTAGIIEAAKRAQSIPQITIQQQKKQLLPDSVYEQLKKRQLDSFKEQKQGIQDFESGLQAPQEINPLLAVTSGLSDMFAGTNRLEGLSRQKAIQEGQAKEDQRYLQAMKKDLTKAEIDMLKSQFQHEQDTEKLGMTMKLAREKMAAESGQKLLPGQESADRAFGKEYQEWNAQGGYAGVEKQLSQLEEAAQALENNPALSGGASTALPDAIRRRLTPEAVTIEQSVKQATQAALRQTLGSQFTEKEGEQIMQRSYDPALPAEENIKKIRSAVKELKTRALEKERASKYFEATGGTLKGLDATGNKQTASTPKTQLAPPAIGEVRGGFKFKGGNPADKNSWEKQ